MKNNEFKNMFDPSMLFNNKHYIRVENGIVIKGFSDAMEQPLDTDICINEHGSRLFEINRRINPPLVNKDGTHVYRYNTELRKATAEELAEELTLINKKANEVEDLILDLLAEQEYRLCLLELGQKEM